MPSPKMFVKICGITRLTDAQAAAQSGANALGFVFEPTSKRFFARDLDWTQWVSRTPMPRVLVAATAETIPQSLPEIALFQALQIYGTSNPTELLASPFMSPVLAQNLSLWIAFRVAAQTDPGTLIKSMTAWEPYADYFLLDAYDPGALGGTGKTLDWEIARTIVKQSPRPVLLAGGLTPNNVQDAIRAVLPFGVDVSTGVESAPGVKSEKKIGEFIQNARATG
ncbi:MAG: phosphoribosylanthranilate isomerase [Fimbriimonadia bacterium]|nr:phosphoribosylanthranilate isomerase [Fimbriimonadia bacterium]